MVSQMGVSHLFTSLCNLRLWYTSRPLENGDIINIDITVFLDGYHGDTSQTFLVGDVVRMASLPLPYLHTFVSHLGVSLYSPF